MKKLPLVGKKKYKHSNFVDLPYDFDNPEEESKRNLMDESRVFGIPNDLFQPEYENEDEYEDCEREYEKENESNLKDTKKDPKKKKKKSNKVKNFTQQVSYFLFDEIKRSRFVFCEREEELIKMIKSKPTISNFDTLFRQKGNLRFFLAKCLFKHNLKRLLLGSKIRDVIAKVRYMPSIQVLIKSFVRGYIKSISVHYSN